MPNNHSQGIFVGGDITNRDGTGFYSIFGGEFADDPMVLKHHCGYVAMANKGKPLDI